VDAVDEDCGAELDAVDGYLDRLARGVYRITERGSLLLSALPAPPRRRKEASIL
jgi:hypothetical protein